ncbi:MAG: hypothetical protein AB7I27_19760 [Bacteriovoracaceae bacterium]
MKFLLTVAVLISSITTSYAFEINCMSTDLEINLTKETISISKWNITDRKTDTFFYNVDEYRNRTYTATLGNVVIISRPDWKSGWGGNQNTYVTDIKNKRSFVMECNIQ